MSVLYAGDVDQSWIDEPQPWTCAECSDEVNPPLVHRRPGHLDLFYHPRCAETVGRNDRRCQGSAPCDQA